MGLADLRLSTLVAKVLRGDIFICSSFFITLSWKSHMQHKPVDGILMTHNGHLMEYMGWMAFITWGPFY